jgi:mRNA interferase MazF
LLIDGGDPDVLLARVTTQLYASQFDVSIAEWSNAGLLAPSVVRLHKVAAIERSLIGRRLGRLSEGDLTNVGACLKRAFGEWPPKPAP